MRKYILICFVVVFYLHAETLFEVKDASNNPVLQVSSDGIAVMNQTDTLMVISTTEIKAVIDDSKALSRKFSVSTTSAKKGLYSDLFDVGMGSAVMREASGGKYSDFNTSNLFLGLSAGYSNGLGNDNVFVGNNSGYSNTSGQHNVYLGMSSGRLNQTNGGNVYLGSYAGEENTKGGNTFVGMFAGKDSGGVGGGGSSTFVGYASGRTAYGGFNTFVGMSSGNNTGNGVENVFIGNLAGFQAVDGNGNVYVGHSAGGNYISLINGGSNNVFIGKSSGSLATGSGNVFIGKESGANETLSNKLYIANSDTSSPLIKGTFPNTDLAINAADIYANGRLTIKGGTAIGMTQAGTVTIGTFIGQSGIKTVTLTYPKAFSTVPKIHITPKGANGVSQSFGVTVRDVTTTTCVIMISQLSPTVNGSWSQNLLADWIAWE